MKFLRRCKQIAWAAGIYSLMQFTGAEAALQSFDTACEREAATDAEIDWELVRRDAEQLALEKAGVFFHSSTQVKNAMVQEDEMEAILGTVAESSVVKREVIDKGNGKKSFRVTVHSVVDTDNIDKMLQRDSNQLAEMELQYRNIVKSYQAARLDYDTLLVQDVQNHKAGLAKKLKINSLLQSAYKLVYTERKQEAQKYIDEALAQDPQNADAYYLRGHVKRYASADGEKQAFADYNRALEYDSQHEGALGERGGILYVRRQFAAAKRDFDKVLKINPLNELIYSEREALQRVMAKPDGGVWAYPLYPLNVTPAERIKEDTDMLQRFHPNSAYIYCRRGKSYAKINAHAKAIADYDKAIELDPSYTAAYIFRAQARMSCMDEVDWHAHVASVESDLEKAVAQAPRFVKTYEIRGDFYRKMARLLSAEGAASRAQEMLSRGERDYASAVELAPTDAHILLKYGDILQEQGRLDFARTYRQRAAALQNKTV